MERIPVTADDVGMRLDRLVRQKLPHTPLSQIYRMMRTNRIKINGKRVKENQRLNEGDILELWTSAAEIARPDASPKQELQNLIHTDFFKRSFKVIYEDEALIICDKPSNLVVHPGSGHTGNDTLIDLARAYMVKSGCGTGGPEPQLVHRIDKDTSGAVMIAKGKKNLRALHNALREGKINKHYVLVCHSAPATPQGVIEVELQKSYDHNDGTKMQVAQDGKLSKTLYKVRRTRDALSLVDAQILTGLTHQIRVHFTHIGCPILGDTRYGDPALDLAAFKRSSAARRLYLHAAKLTFPHPITNVMITVTADLPEAFESIWK